MNFEKLPDIDYSRLARRHHRRLRMRQATMLLVAGLVGLAIWWVRRESAAADQRMASERIGRLEAKLAASEGRFATAGDDRAARLTVLEESASILTEVIRNRGRQLPAENNKLHGWLTEIANLKATQMLARSRELEAEGAAAAERGDAAAAASAYREAGRWQREVNNSGADSGQKNYAREVQMEQLARQVVEEPRGREIRAAVAAAEGAAAAGDSSRALAAYRQARQWQAELNRDFPDSAYADMAAIERLDQRINSLLAAEFDAGVRAALTEARAAAREKRDADAEALLARASDLQQQINREYAGSQYASIERLDEIEVERQTVRAAPSIREVVALDERAAAHLRRRELYQAVQLVREAAAQLEKISSAEPRARGVDGELRLKLGFLTVHADDLTTVQDGVYELLRPLTGRVGLAVLGCEVPQSLFALVMNSNPSRNVGRDSPVDSATHAEAAEFCRRLGWIMGCKVRLPDRAERADSNVPASPDLSEWLRDDAAGRETAPVFRSGTPVSRMPRAERDRSRSFRVVVETDLAAPAKIS